MLDVYSVMRSERGTRLEEEWQLQPDAHIYSYSYRIRRQRLSLRHDCLPAEPKLPTTYNRLLRLQQDARRRLPSVWSCFNDLTSHTSCTTQPTNVSFLGMDLLIFGGVRCCAVVEPCGRRILP